MKTYILTLVLSIASAVLVQGQTELQINEFLAGNVLALADSSGDYDDWIELSNQTGDAIDFAGLYLSDELANLKKWQIPSGVPSRTVVADSGFLLIWADGQPEQGPLHANFNLSRAGDFIMLVAADGISILDSVSFGQQRSDISFGRDPLMRATWGYCGQATPRQANSVVYTGFTKAPEIVEPSGFYPEGLAVSLKSAGATTLITYSLDGLEPTPASAVYTEPIMIAKTGPLRVRGFAQGLAPSESVSRYFFVAAEPTLPVLALVTDPGNLFGDQEGIYANPLQSGRQWERRVACQFFAASQLQFTLDAGLRIQGNTGREFDKKSFRLFFRKGYGQKRLEYPMFAGTTVASFENLVLRAGYDDDLQQPDGTLLRDPLVTELWRRLGHLTPHSRFALLYLNGDFWGIYDSRESVNPTFVADQTGFSNFDMVRLRWGDWELKAGDATAWQTMLDFFRQGTFESDSALAAARHFLDLKVFTDLHALVNATSYRNWSYGVFAYRDRATNGPWRWTIWDMDKSYTFSDWNHFATYDKPDAQYWINFIAGKLLQNQSYRDYFIKRHADLMNTILSPQMAQSVLYSMAARLEPEMAQEASRWQRNESRWHINVARLREAIDQRRLQVLKQMQRFFQLGRRVDVTLGTTGGPGTVKLNTVQLSQMPWTGEYFAGMTVELTAFPAKDYRFVKWLGANLPTTETVSLTLQDDVSLTAVFETIPQSNIELIVPAAVLEGSHLPLVARIRALDGSFDPWANLELKAGVANKTAARFEAKKGAGTAFFKPAATEDFTVTVSGEGVGEAKKTVVLDPNYPRRAYSGSLSRSAVVWSADTIRVVENDLTLPAGGSLSLQAGTVVVLKQPVNMFVYGELVAEGTAERPVLFTSASRTKPWGGIEFFATRANFSYTFFVNGGADPRKGWAHTHRQPLLFAKEKTELTLDNCFLLNSRGKALGAQNSRVTVRESVTAFVWHGGEFHHTLLDYRDSHIMNIPNDDGIFQDEDNDGFHIDSVYTGSDEFSVIDNCFFVTGKDDAIDHHGARLEIRNCWIDDWIHEGVATSAQDSVQVFNTLIKGCEQGIEIGWTDTGLEGVPHVTVDHCVVVDNEVGLRFGDSYALPNYAGRMLVTNTVLYDNGDNILNFVKTTKAPNPAGIDISYSMTNDTEYDSSAHNLAAVPLFDPHFFLQPGSPGIGAGVGGSNLGLVVADTTSPPRLPSVVVITEIMYNAAGNRDSGDWIELYNPWPDTLRLGSWLLRDKSTDNRYEFPAQTVIPAQGYLVACRDRSRFLAVYPQVGNLVGNVGFGFGRGDQVRLFAPTGQLVDSVAYDIAAPWSNLADGRGHTLELIDPDSDNALPQNWRASRQPGGSPGEPPPEVTRVTPAHEPPLRFALRQNYPNPFNASTRLVYELPQPGQVSLVIYNLLGQRLALLLDGEPQEAGTHQVTLDASTLSSGIYFYRIAVVFRDGLHRSLSKKLVTIR